MTYDSIKIYDSTLDVTKYIGLFGETTTELNTVILMTKHKSFFGGHSYSFKICQNDPRCKKAFYDGEHSNNRYIETVMNLEKHKAEIWLETNRQRSIDMYNPDIISDGINNEQEFVTDMLYCKYVDNTKKLGEEALDKDAWYKMILNIR